MAVGAILVVVDQTMKRNTGKETILEVAVKCCCSGKKQASGPWLRVIGNSYCEAGESITAHRREDEVTQDKDILVVVVVS
jgi:hypothetical protein